MTRVNLMMGSTIFSTSKNLRESVLKILEPVHDLCNNEEKACFGELQGEKSKRRLVAWADFLTQ
jgi:hypothetical protein